MHLKTMCILLLLGQMFYKCQLGQVFDNIVQSLCILAYFLQ